MSNSIIVNSVTLTVPNADICPLPDPACPDGDCASPCSCNAAPVANASGLRMAGGAPSGPRPVLVSIAPIRYSKGELRFTETDLASEGYGVGWQHTRSFSSRLNAGANVGNGYNWQITDGSYLVFSGDTVVVMGSASNVLWFDLVNGQYVPRFNVRNSLTYSAASNRYQLYGLDGSVTEFCGASGRFCAHRTPAGDTITVISTTDNGFNLGEVQRTYTTGGVTTTESFVYTYIDATLQNPYLSSVLLRRKVGAGAWTDVLKVNYTYYSSGDAYGSAGDLKTAHRRLCHRPVPNLGHWREKRREPR